MKLDRVSSPIENPLVEQYWGNESWVQSFFPYTVNQQSFSERLSWINNQTYDRQRLVEVIQSYMAPYTISEKAQQHLTALAKDALVVVGGQQAGLLTGPLFSIYKAITVILLAQQQSELLGQPVVPVFWIAGEDNDIDEINHTYTMQNGRVKKQIFGDSQRVKKMASATQFEREALTQYVQTIFKDYGETSYSNELLKQVLAPIDTTSTYTEYFTALLQQLFQQQGLLFIDAAYGPFRQYEASLFETLIEANEDIAQAVVEQEAKLVEQGFSAPLSATLSNANLFYVDNGERYLLERKGDEFIYPLKGLRFTKQELLTIAKEQPQRLSNNVVTRPLMQEMTLPVLAFVGGSGELAYWATLKTAFEAVQLQMPIFVPRLSATVVSRQVQVAMEHTNITVQNVFNKEVPMLKENFIERQKSVAVLQTIADMEQQLVAQYELLSEQLVADGIQLAPTLERNENYHHQQFSYLQRKLQQQYELKHETLLRQMSVVESQLLPNDKPQERLYSVYQLLNTYGATFIEDLMKQVEAIERQHIVVQL